MSKPHKWAKEIKHFIDGGEVEYSDINHEEWLLLEDIYQFGLDYKKYRIKPQPKEPQYLYVYGNENGVKISKSKASAYYSLDVECRREYPYIGKIKLEQDTAIMEQDDE